MTTDKQKFRLKKAGYTDEQIDKMDWKQVSDIIGKLPAYHKEVIEPNTEQIVSSGYKKEYVPHDNISYYVAYAKDLCIALIEANKMAVIAGKAEPIEVGKLMTEAIFEIRKAKGAFEANK